MINKEEQIQLAQELISDKVKEYMTTIIIGRAVDVFKSIYKGFYDTISTAEDIREFLDKWNMPYDKPIVFEDISLLTPIVQVYLLKFIEEPPAPLIILAKEDNISPIILSRCKHIIKLPDKFNYQPISINEFIAKKEEAQDNDQDFNVYREALEHCPEYIYMTTKLAMSKHNIHKPDRYLKLLY